MSLIHGYSLRRLHQHSHQCLMSATWKPMVVCVVSDVHCPNLIYCSTWRRHSLLFTIIFKTLIPSITQRSELVVLPLLLILKHSNILIILQRKRGLRYSSPSPTLKSLFSRQNKIIHSFIPAISIAPLQVLYSSEALPT